MALIGFAWKALFQAPGTRLLVIALELGCGTWFAGLGHPPCLAEVVSPPLDTAVAVVVMACRVSLEEVPEKQETRDQRALNNKKNPRFDYVRPSKGFAAPLTLEWALLQV